jgi:glycerophosphoryl diester phosphodiesterase
MAVPVFAERAYMRLVDALVARRRQPRPSSDALRRCRLISHRGEYDNRSVMENSLAAFDRAAAAGVWGIECDVRWTRDGVPVVTHDADLMRLRGDRRRVDEMTFAQLRVCFPGVAALADLVERFGRRLHLMIEFKHDPRWSNSTRQNRSVAPIFSALRPVEDFHFLTLAPHLPPPVTFAPDRAWVSIAAHWPDKLCRHVLARDWAGVCGHYSVMRASLIRRLQHSGKRVGTGYADSPHCLFRELNRGIDWIFSNRAAAMQAVVNRALYQETV